MYITLKLKKKKKDFILSHKKINNIATIKLVTASN